MTHYDRPDVPKLCRDTEPFPISAVRAEALCRSLEMTARHENERRGMDRLIIALDGVK